MVWMPVGCPVCKSDKRSRSAICLNQERDGTPCLGMDAEQAAIYRANQKFLRDEIDMDELDELLEIAMTNPPKRSFGCVLQFR
jgi:hypothetical protein